MLTFKSTSRGLIPRFAIFLLSLAGIALLSFGASTAGSLQAQAVENITASISGMPSAHDGSSQFTFELHFDPEPVSDFSYRTVRDNLFSVSGGSITKADRLVRGSNAGWRVYVQPSVEGDLTLTLTETQDCEQPNSVCTAEGGRLTTNLLRLVPGPASVAENSPATGSPTISGTVQVGEALTADTSGISDSDGLDNVTFGYQWVAGGTDISGATGSTYTLTSGEEGQTIQVRVSFTDDAGNQESLTSVVTGAVAARPNSVAGGAPTISGTAQVGETLTADTSGMSDADGLINATFSYQWMRNDGSADSAIQGAISSSYTLDDDDEGNTVKVRVSFTDDASNEESLTSAGTSEVDARPSSPATVIAPGSPTVIQNNNEFSLDLASLSISVADQNGTTIDLGTFDPAVTEYSADVASTVESVTVKATAELDISVSIYLAPGEYINVERNTDAHQVNLSHGKNLILVGVHSWNWADEPLRVYTVEINRAGSASQGEENYLRISSLSRALEGSTLPFLLTRSGDTSEVLTASVDIWQSYNTNSIFILPHLHRQRLRSVITLKRVKVEFPAGSASAIVNYETPNDSLFEGGYHLGATLVEGTGYRVPSFYSSGRFAGTLVGDDDRSKPTLRSLSLTDQNGTAVATGEFDPDRTSYSGTVGSEATHVTVTRATTQASDFVSRVLPPDSQPDVDGHQVALQHGANLISVIVATFYDDVVISGTYDVVVTRAGSPSGATTPTISVFGLGDEAREGYMMPFVLTRTGDTSQSLTVPVNVSETGDMVPQGSEGRSDTEFEAGNAWARIEVPTFADLVWEEHSTVTVSVVDGPSHDPSPESGSASSTVKDNDVPNVTATFTVNSNQAQEGQVVTASVTATTDGPKKPHKSVGRLDFRTELGTAQQEDFYYGSRSTRFYVNEQAMQPVVSSNVITHYQYQFSFPIHIVDDDRAEADETFDINVEWDSPTQTGGNTLTMDQGITSRTITISGHDDTPESTDPVSYITVAIADSGSTGSTYTISWNDTRECSSSYGYEAYVNRTGTSGWTSFATVGRTGRENTQLVETLDTFPSGGQRIAVYCGDMGRLVSEVPIPSATENSVERPVPGTYSSEPALTGLTVSGGTLGPAFQNQGFLYSVLDLPNDNEQITLIATAKSGYSISWEPAADADPDAAGHQVDLQVGYNSIFISADHDLGVNSFVYEVIVERVGSSQQQRANTKATGVPTVGGTAQVGETLTASTSAIADADGLENAEFRYQWLADDTDIAGAATQTHILTEVELGKAITVKVTFTDDGGNEETLTAAPTALVTAGSLQAQAVENITASISGMPSAHDGSSQFTFELHFDPEPVSDFSYRTVRDNLFSVSGGSITKADRLVRGSNAGWRVYVQPSVEGDLTLTLTETQDCEQPNSVCTAEGGRLTTNLLRLVPGPASVAENSPATGSPTISGTVQVGEALTADTSGISDSDGLDNVTFGYQWVAGGTDISGATGSTYTLTSGEEGQTIQVRVSFTDDAGNQESLTSSATEAVAAKANSPATGSPTISGTVQVGETLTASTSGIADDDGLTNATYNYQWIGGGSDISGVTGSSHTLTSSEQGQTIQVRVSFTDDAGNQESLTSSATEAVAAKANSPATGSPTISGTVQVGETLTASTSGIADDDGLTNATYSYQWISGGSDISGATGSGHTLTSSEQGQTIQVRVSFTDDAENDESVTSNATQSVIAAPSPLTVNLTNNPTSHDGSAVFTFEIRFSEDFHLSYKTLRDSAFIVTAGAVKKAERLVKGSNVGWLITIQPDSNAAVTVALPITTDCDDQGAICTGDGRMLSNQTEITVTGPGG